MLMTWRMCKYERSHKNGRGINMFQPTVSIIVTTYNRRYELAELFASLAAQTYQDFEVIIVNDAGEPVEDVVALYPELSCHLIHLTENHYHVYARNCALKHVRGKFILLMDDDDLLLPTHLEVMTAELQDSDLVYSDVEIVNYRESHGHRIPVSHQLFAYHGELTDMRKFSTFVPSGSLYRATIHQEIGDFDEAVRNYWDWDFFLRTAERFHVKRVPIASVLYAFSEEGNNQSKQTDRMRNYLDRLSAKHNLGELPTMNFRLLLEEPEMKRRQAWSKRIWDGESMPETRLKE